MSVQHLRLASLIECSRFLLHYLLLQVDLKNDKSFLAYCTSAIITEIISFLYLIKIYFCSKSISYVQDCGLKSYQKYRSKIKIKLPCLGK